MGALSRPPVGRVKGPVVPVSPGRKGAWTGVWSVRPRQGDGCTWGVLTSRVALAGEEGGSSSEVSKVQGSQNTKDSSNGAAGLAVVSPLAPPRI